MISGENEEIVAIENDNNIAIEAQIEDLDLGEIAGNPYDTYVPNMDDNDMNFGDDMGYSLSEEIQDFDENINNKFKL